MHSKILKSLKFLVLLIGLSAMISCGSSSNKTKPTELTGLTITPTALPDGQPIGVTQQFTAVGTFSNNTKQDLTKTVTWSSSATAVATINASGLETAGTTPGNANITATSGGKTSNSVAIKVLDVSVASLVSLAISPPTVPNDLVTGLTLGFTAEGTFSNGETYTVTEFVDWASDDLGVATISATGIAKGEFPGPANITASASAPALVTSNTVALTVINATVTGVVIEPQSFDTLPANRTQQLSAYAIFSNNSFVDITNTSTWTSSNTGVATVITSVANAGRVTGIGTGTAVITATDNNSSALFESVTVTVNDATITAVNVNPAKPGDLPAGFSEEFTASGTFTDGKTRKLINPLSWAVSNASIASLESPGEKAEVSGLKAGKVDVSYTDLLADGMQSGKTGKSELTVTTALLVSIEINPGVAFSIPAGGQHNFTAIGTYTAGPTRVITSEVDWVSSNTSIVSFGPSGKMTAVVAGGPITVLAKSSATSSPSPTTSVTVNNSTLASLTIHPQLDPELVGFSRQFSVTGTYTGTGNTSSYTQRVLWTSSDTGVATVSNDIETIGMVTGVAAGFTTLTATDPQTSISTTLVVTVSQL